MKLYKYHIYEGECQLVGEFSVKFTDVKRCESKIFVEGGSWFWLNHIDEFKIMEKGGKIVLFSFFFKRLNDHQIKLLLKDGENFLHRNKLYVLLPRR